VLYNAAEVSEKGRMVRLTLPIGTKDCGNLVGGVFQLYSGEQFSAFCPYNGKVIGNVACATEATVQQAVAQAVDAHPAWRRLTAIERSLPLFHLRALLLRHEAEFANLVASEVGCTFNEAAQEIAFSVNAIDETLRTLGPEPRTSQSRSLAVQHEEERLPLGLVAGITPHCSPVLLPVRLAAAALVNGNALLLKPSPSAALSAARLGELMQLAGFPPGTISILNGDQETGQLLLSQPEVQAVACVGNSLTARSVYTAATLLGKRAVCLGGTQNHVVVMPDAAGGHALRSVVDAFTHHAGQSCFSARVLVCVGSAASIAPQLAEVVAAVECARDHGVMLHADAREQVCKHIEDAVQSGSRLLLDGRTSAPPGHFAESTWLGPSILEGVPSHWNVAQNELLGPLLCVQYVDTLEEAILTVQNSHSSVSASIFTQSGGTAREFAQRVQSAAVFVNSTLPDQGAAPRFSASPSAKFGAGELVGSQAIDFWTRLKHVTTQWGPLRS
jgi:malonate-semialdehyde dehydrogenase (acetylating) / methylmalonate-semialdehyde dehydrogenase